MFQNALLLADCVVFRSHLMEGPDTEFGLAFLGGGRGSVFGSAKDIAERIQSEHKKFTYNIPSLIQQIQELD